MQKPNWIENIDGHWLFVKDGKEIARLAPSYDQKYGKLYITWIEEQYPEFGYAAVDINTVSQGKKFIEEWWDYLQSTLEHGYFVQNDDGSFEITEKGRKLFLGNVA